MAATVILRWMDTASATNWILLANLAAVGAYVWLTWGIKRASNEQSESLSKPILALRGAVTIERNSPAVGLPETVARAVPDENGYYELINIGNGPAVHVACTIRSPNLPGDAPQSVSAPYLEAKEHLTLPLSTRMLSLGNPDAGYPRRSIRCCYASLAENKYESIIELKGERIESFRFRRGGH